MEVQVSVAGSYRRPVLRGEPWIPPQTIISDPVQMAVCWERGSGDHAGVGVHESAVQLELATAADSYDPSGTASSGETFPRSVVHQLSKLRLGQVTVAVLSESASVSRTAVTENASDLSSRRLSRRRGRCAVTSSPHRSVICLMRSRHWSSPRTTVPNSSAGEDWAPPRASFKVSSL